MKSSINPGKSTDKRRSLPARDPVAKEQIARTTSGPAWWHWALGLLVAVTVAFQIYGPALHGEFLFDDSYLPFLMPNVADAPLRAWLGVRPLLMLSYWLNYQSSGLDPYPYHAAGVLLHAFNSVLAALIVRRLLTWVGELGWRREAFAGFAGALFLLHPVQTESVAYVASRSETLSVFFFLSAYAVFLYRPAPAITLLRTAGVLLLFGLACSVKEHTVVLPALLLLTDYLFVTPFQLTAIRNNVKLYATIGIGALLGVAGVVAVLSRAQTAGFQIKEFTWYEYLFTQFRVIWLYLRLYVLPYGQNGDYQIAVSRTIFDHGSIFGLLGLIALGGLAWRFRREFPLAAFGFVAFLLLLAPTSSIVPIRDVAAERRLYLPFIGLLLITVDLLRRWTLSRTAMLGVLGGVCAVAGVLTYSRSEVWSNALVFWQDTSAKSPNNSRALFQLAYAQWQSGKCDDAVRNYERVSKMDNPDDRLLLDWALALECVNKPDEAVAKVHEAMKTAPTAHGWATIGMIYGKRNRVDEALAALSNAEKLDPRFEMTYVYRGNIFASRGQMPTAASEYKRALEINPGNPAAQQGLAMAQSSR